MGINVPRNSECVAATYGFKNENAITGYAFGQAEIVDPEHPTRLMVTFEEFGGCGAQANLCGSVQPDEAAKFDTEDGATFNYRVMETDYENYTLVNSCVGTAKNHIEWLYFLTRERTWPDENQVKVQELLYQCEQWGLDIDSLR